MSEQGTIKVEIGSIVASSGGLTRDTRRTVKFEGVELATYSEAGLKDDGTPTDTRGRTETLYRVADERLVVHVEDWSHWQGEPTTSWLVEVTKADLGPAGPFAFLGEAAGMSRPLTVDEALVLGDVIDDDALTQDELDAYQEGYDEGLEAGRNLVDDGLPRRALHTAA